MNNLIKNELKKIFHKKSIYIVLIITIIFTILNTVITSLYNNNENSYLSNDIEYYKEQISEMEKGKIEDKDYYLSLKAQLKIAELSQKYDSNSWQFYIISNKGYELMSNMFSKEGTSEYENYKKNFDQFVNNLEKSDWRYFANEELKDIETQIQELEQQKDSIKDNNTIKSLEQQIQGLLNNKQIVMWRLEKDIPYGNSNKNRILEQWLLNKQNIESYRETEKTKKISYSDKYEYQNCLESVNLCEYNIKENIVDNVSLNTFNNRENLASNADSELIKSFENYKIFILIAIVIIAGTIISEEFNKGTIKLLLVRPYKRLKILLAKFFACMIVLCLAYVVVALLQFVVGGFTKGFSSYMGKVYIYSFKTNSVEIISTFKYLVLTGLSILPQYVLLMTLAFSLSVIFVNSPIAIGLPLLGLTGAELINDVAYNVEKANFLRFFVTPNWDLSIYLFGKLPEYEPISFAFSIAICVIYFVIMCATNIFVFNHKEIKNI